MAPRPILMKAPIPALALAALLAACGTESGDDDPDVAGQDQTNETPTVAPTGPPWPEFPHEDYTFVFSHECFCGDAGVRIRVTVVDGEPVEAVYADAGRGVQPGDPATEEWQLITLDDVIDHANTEGAADVQVEWPAGQEHPDRVWVDRDERMSDEELGYTVHRVTVA